MGRPDYRVISMIENLKQIIEQSQRTQRNWDLNKSVKDEDIELFKNCLKKSLNVGNS